LRAIRTRQNIPTRKILIDFIEEDYRYLTSDTRITNEIILDLLSEDV
jgi:hypothetical protein